jgi:signal transduction histidine kinase
MAATTARLLRFARPARHDGPGRLASVADVLAGTLHVMGYLARQRGVTLRCTIPEDLPAVRADEDALREVFTNLIGNAIDAAGADVRVGAARDGGGIVIDVEDDGPGVPEAVRRRLFEPFVSSADGTGLGLYIAARRVRELGGAIRCETGADRRGTVFTVEIPCGTAESPGRVDDERVGVTSSTRGAIAID